MFTYTNADVYVGVRFVLLAPMMIGAPFVNRLAER